MPVGKNERRGSCDGGNAVSDFLAGDAVQLLRDEVLENLVGLGTGSLQDSYDAVVAAGGQLFASGMSSKARGLRESDIDGKPVKFAMPSDLVELALEHDRMFTY